MAKQRKIKGLCLVLILLMLCAQTAQAAWYATIRPGAVGPQVVSVQQALNSLGYKLAADGKYGLQTTQAVRAFQSAQRLTADGLAGNQTLTALYALAPDFAPNAPSPTVSASSQQPAATQRYEMGSYGEGVAQLQVRLNALGYDCQRTDGVFDDVHARRCCFSNKPTG